MRNLFLRLTVIKQKEITFCSQKNFFFKKLFLHNKYSRFPIYFIIASIYITQDFAKSDFLKIKK